MSDGGDVELRIHFDPAPGDNQFLSLPDSPRSIAASAAPANGTPEAAKAHVELLELPGAKAQQHADGQAVLRRPSSATAVVDHKDAIYIRSPEFPVRAAALFHSGNQSVLRRHLVSKSGPF